MIEINSKRDLLNLICSDKNKSGYHTREVTWKTLYPVFYSDLQSWVFPDEFTFNQKVYHFLNNDPDLILGLCPECSKRCKFESMSNGYYRFCSKKCSANSKDVREKSKQACLEKYGTMYVFQSDEFKEKYKETCLDRYGVENPSQLEEFQEKKKQTCLGRYGKESFSQTDEYRDKVKQTCLEKYGVENYTNREKSKQTCLDRYGVENHSQTDEFKEKYRETCLDRYGVDHYSKTDEYRERVKETCLDRYGVECSSQSEEVKERAKQTCLERYGYEYSLQSEDVRGRAKQTCLDRYGTEYASQTGEFKEKVKQTCLDKYGTEYYLQSDDKKEKQKQTCLEKYGVENYSQTDEYREKCYQSKKKNNSFNSSKVEDQLKEYFDLNGIKYIHQYKSDLYPFNCDFYFPDRDLYVEIQGNWTHGSHPFTGSEEDLDTLKMWESKGTKYYENAIESWSIRDVKKRETAKKNNLNWIEIFSCDFKNCKNILEQYI